MSRDYRKNLEQLAILFDTNATIGIATSNRISRDVPAESHSIRTRERFFLVVLFAVPARHIPDELARIRPQDAPRDRDAELWQRLKP